MAFLLAFLRQLGQLPRQRAGLRWWLSLVSVQTVGTHRVPEGAEKS